MTRSDRFDLDLPNDFPLTAVESIHAHLSDRHPDANQTTEWMEWANALNGVLYRFLACDEDGRAAISSLEANTSPPQPERYRQERSLFGFFFNGLSAVECLMYGLYFVASLADPTGFPETVDRREVTPRFVTDRFTTHATFGTERIALAIDVLTASQELAEWRDLRNFLGHRGAPGRTFYEGGNRHGGVDWNLPIPQVDVTTLLEPSELRRRREWLAAQLREVCDAANAFVVTHVP